MADSSDHRIVDQLTDLKHECRKLLQEQHDFIKWIEDYAHDLSLMVHIFKDDKKQLHKIEGKMELIMEIINYFNGIKKETEQL